MWGKVFVLTIIIQMSAMSANILGCNYHDTVDLKGSKRFENGSYLYEGIIIPIDKIETYNYEIAKNGEHILVSNYPRGCICQVKSCVFFCCDPEKLIENLNMKINFLNEIRVKVKYEIPCDLLKDKKAQDQRKLFEKGILLSQLERSGLGKEDYSCLLPRKVSDDNIEFVTLFFEPEIRDINRKSVNILFYISFICMIFTIFVYLFLPQFQSIHGKCCVCYFICFTINIMLQKTECINRHKLVSNLTCYMIGYSGYSTVLAEFLWLLVINLNLWSSFKNYVIPEQDRMHKYHTFVGSSASLLLVITGLVDYTCRNKECSWQPAVGLYSCWINTAKWSAIIYYYGPIWLIILVNLTLSIITAKHIHVENRNNGILLNKSGYQNNLTNQANFVMFFRMFGIAVVSVLPDTFELLDALFKFDILSSAILYFINIIISAQGIFLFFLATWKRNVLQSLYDRLMTRGEKGYSI